MAAIELNMKYLDQPTKDALMNVIELRRRELGQTTKQAAVAIMINSLKSLRGDTKIANTRNYDIDVKDWTAAYEPSFKRNGNQTLRVIRDRNTGRTVTDFSGAYVYWDVKKYKRNEQYKVFRVVDRIPDNKNKTYIIVTKSQERAMSLAKSWHIKRVKKHQKLAKYALGIAMNKVNSAQKISDNVIPQVAKTGLSNIKAVVRESGYDSGEVEILVHDQLNYAAEALKSGKSFVQTAVQKALNQSVGQIIQKMKSTGKITDSIAVPFPEVRGK